MTKEEFERADEIIEELDRISDLIEAFSILMNYQMLKLVYVILINHIILMIKLH